MKHTIAKAIALLSVLIGILVIIGWYLDITVLTSILPQWIRMKIATAVCFISSGIIVFLLSVEQEKKNELRQFTLVALSMINMLMMGTLFLGSIFGFQSGMENFAFVDTHEVATPIFQGRPSVATMIDFLLIAAIALAFSFKKQIQKPMIVVGSIVSGIGLLGVIGYLTRIPYLYFEIPGFSNAIAIHTTILFALLGFAIVLIGRKRT